MKHYKSILLALIVAGVMFLLYDKYCKKESYSHEEYFNSNEESKEDQIEEKNAEERDIIAEVTAFQGNEPLSLNNPEDTKIQLGSCGNAGSFISSNLLPKQDSKMQDGSEFAPKLDGKNFVDSYKYMIGSQSQSLRNANYQLRSDPPNPSDVVCPWSQSTILPETRRQLEIGS